MNTDTDTTPALGPADARLCEIRDRCRAIHAELRAITPAPDEDDLSDPLLDEFHALRIEALSTVPNDARGAAVQARFHFMRTCNGLGNEMGDYPPDSLPDGHPIEWHVAKALESKALAVDPGFEVWPDHGAAPAVTNDRKILDAWHERRRAVEDLKRVDHSHLSRVEADAADAVYIERIYACDVTIMDTPTDGFAGFAVKAKLSYAKNCDELGNESGDRTIPEGAHPQRDDALMARLANELERRAGVRV